MVPETLEMVPSVPPHLIDTELPGYEAAQMQIPPLLSKYQKLDPFKDIEGIVPHVTQIKKLLDT